MNHLKQLLLKMGFSCSHCCYHPNHEEMFPRSHQRAQRAEERTAGEQPRNEDSMGDEDEHKQFIAMDHLKKDAPENRVQTEIKVERSKKSDDERAHRPSDPLLTTSTKFTGI